MTASRSGQQGSRLIRPVTAVRLLGMVALLVIVLARLLPAEAASTAPVATSAVADAGSAESGLSVSSATILGVVEGLTEYLPVSSTGHLLVSTRLLGLGGTPEADKALDAYAICIQAGAILAVLLLYWRRIAQMLEGMVGRSDEGRRVLVALIAAFLPTAVIGFLLKDPVEHRLFGVGPVAVAWLVGGVAILVMERQGFLHKAGHGLDELTARQAAIIGLVQAVALWPGVSRSLITIVGAVVVGLSLPAAVEFSFLLGLVTLGAATVLTAASDGKLMVDTFGTVTPLIGLAVAFLAAVVSIQWMITWLQSRSFDVFGWYRLAVGAVALGAVLSGRL